jgi:hypothetical protein
MLYAIDDNGNKVTSTPGANAMCPFCGCDVIAKCGDINIWHWAHRVSTCDSFSESETEWHLAWKSKFPKEYVEVAVEHSGIKHIADIRLRSGLVIEFQHSPLSPSEIYDREAFYGDMLWVIDIQDCADYKPTGHGVLTPDGWYAFKSRRFETKDKGNHFTFSWKHPRKHIAYIEKKLYLDFHPFRLFEVRKMYSESTPFRGWGYEIYKDDFVFRLTPVVGDAASPPSVGEQTRTSGQAGEGSAPHPPRA